MVGADSPSNDLSQYMPILDFTVADKDIMRLNTNFSKDSPAGAIRRISLLMGNYYIVPIN
nr:MAG TPA: hypothetical protein [Caudoviricetes sp.]